MSQVLELLNHKKYVSFSQLFTRKEGRAGAVVSFLAILELVKESMVELSQVEPMSDIRLSLRQHNQDESVTA